MTDLLTAPSRPATSSPPAPPIVLVGLLAGLALAIAGALACSGLAVAGWLADSDAPLTAALRVGALGWLLGHGSGITAADWQVTAVPLGLTMGIAYAAWRGGRWVAGRARPRDAGGVTLAAIAFGVGYTAVVIGVAAIASGGPTVSVSIPRAAGVSFVLTVAVAWVGAAREADVLGPLTSRLPLDLRAAARGAAAGTAVVVGASAVVLTGLLVLGSDRVGMLAGSLDAGAVGGALIVLLTLAAYPNALALTGSVLLGPGFTFGTGTTVTATTVTIGTLPAFPLLAAVPGSGPTPAATGALALVPVLGGLLAGWLGVRAAPVFGFDRAALRGALAGLLAGLVTGAFVAAADGSVGPGRMADVGPATAACLAVAVAAMGVGGILGGIGRHLVHHRRS